MKLRAIEVPPPTKKSNYPEPFASRMGKREKRKLGDAFGLTKFGVNLTILAPGGESALLHRHTKQEEFVFILKGTPTLVTDDGEEILEPGDCVGFRPNGPAHKLENRSREPVHYLEVGDREAGDEATYPNDDLKALMKNGNWVFTRKDGTPW